MTVHSEGSRVIALTGRTQPRLRRNQGRSLALAELSGTLAEFITNTSALLDRVVELVSRYLGDAAALVLIDDSGKHARFGAAYDADAYTRAVVTEALASPPQKGASWLFCGVAARDARPLLFESAGFEAVLSTLPPEARYRLRDVGVHSALVCPLRVRGKVIGSLSLWRHNHIGPLSEPDRWFAQELTDRAALAIENARLVERLHTELQERKRSEARRRRTAELLQQESEKRKTLIEHLVAAQEEERRRIAVDVHDDSIQAMAAIRLRLQLLRRQPLSAELARRVAEIEEAVTESIARLRGLLIRLESAFVEKEGLARAIDRCIEDLFPNEPPHERVLSRLTTEPPEYAQVVLFRVAQEAITNVCKHSRASEFSVVLSEESGGTLLVVQDAGIGFDPEDLAAHSLPGHMGLRAMRQRAEVAGGWLRVDSEPGKGTTIRCWLPAMKLGPRALGSVPSRRQGRAHSGA